MKIDRTNPNYDVVTPEDKMWLFNGETFSDSLFVPKGYNVSKYWQEVTDDFKKQWEIEHAADNAELPTN